MNNSTKIKLSQDSQIHAFLSSDARNKLIIHSEPITGFTYLDVGLVFAQLLRPLINDPKISLKAHNALDQLLRSSIIQHANYGEVLAIKNVGILMESELKIDIIQLFDRYSQNNSLFVLWAGEIENDDLFFLKKDSGLKLSLKHISHITI